MVFNLTPHRHPPLKYLKATPGLALIMTFPHPCSHAPSLATYILTQSHSLAFLTQSWKCFWGSSFFFAKWGPGLNEVLAGWSSSKVLFDLYLRTMEAGFFVIENPCFINWLHILIFASRDFCFALWNRAVIRVSFSQLIPHSLLWLVIRKYS